jgi:quercetin dioxygenase-like cupin family protein
LSLYNRNIAHLSNLPEESTNHLQGTKKVFLRNEDTSTNLTQFAFATLKQGSTIENHAHQSMEELFYVTAGHGKVSIGEQSHDFSIGSFIRIPIGEVHSFFAESDVAFVYFGIAK